VTKHDVESWAVRFALDVIRDNGPQTLHSLRKWITDEAYRRFPGGPGFSRRAAVRIALDEAVAAGLLVAELDCMPGDEELRIKRIGTRNPAAYRESLE